MLHIFEDNTTFWSNEKVYKVLTFPGLKLNIHCTFNKLLFLGYSIVYKRENTRKKRIDVENGVHFRIFKFFL